MERIARSFARGKAFIGFITAGDPSIEASEEFALALEKAGADIIELGIPFSDPIAEGPVIQEANVRALAAGATVEKVFALAGRIRAKSDVPLVFLSYFNPVFRCDCDAFFARCRETGVDALIVPDLPFEEQDDALEAAAAHGVSLISLIAPTSEDRVAAIAARSRGFLYVVSSMGVTGARSEIKTDLEHIITAARSHTKTPCAVGFGINTPEQAAAVARIADGVIVGSAIVSIIAEHGAAAAAPLSAYAAAIKAAIAGATF